MFQKKTLAFIIGILFCCFPIIGISQLQVSVVLPMQMPAELSEWQTNPALVQIIITALPGTPEYSTARCEFFIRNTDNQNVVVSTKPNHPSIPRFPINSGPSTQIRFGRDIIQMMSLNINREYEANFLATNSLPEGNYEFCLEIYDDRTNQLIYSSTLQGICSQFVVVVPDPPSLILPSDSDVILSNYPVFSWTPVMNADGSIIRYNLKIVPLFEGQNARFALDYNEVLAEIKDIQSTSYLYSPIDRPFIQYPQAIGFAWQVQAVTLQGKPATRNNGKSELFTFFLQKDTSITPFSDNEETDTETETEPPVYIPNKKRSVQFGEFWVTLANDIECASCILNVNGFAFLPFLNDSVAVTLINVPVTNIDKPNYEALSGEASNQIQFATKSKHAISILFSSLKLTPEKATLQLSASIDWQQLGWMNGNNVSTPIPIEIQPNTIQQGIPLSEAWKREGNQVGLNSLFAIQIDSLSVYLSHSKLDVNGSLSICPTKNQTTTSNINFDCVSTTMKLSDGEATVVIEKTNSPISVKSPLSLLNAKGFSFDLSANKSFANSSMPNEWRGVQISDVQGELYVKAPFVEAFPMKVDAQSIAITPTSTSFVHSGVFIVDSLSCLYGGFPLSANSGSLQLLNNQSTSEALKGIVSLLKDSKPANWTDIDNIPVEIYFDQDLQMKLEVASTKNENKSIAALPLSFEGVTDKIALTLTNGIFNVQSATEGTLTFLNPTISNTTQSSILPIESVVFRSTTNTIQQTPSLNANSYQRDFSIHGAKLTISNTKFDYTSAKEYTLSFDGYFQGIGKKMPKTLKSIPFEQLVLSSTANVSSKSAPFEFSFSDTYRAFGSAKILSEQIDSKKFWGIKGSAKSSSTGTIPFQNQQSTFYIGSLDGKPFWLMTNTSNLLSSDELLEPQKSEQRTSAFTQFVQSNSTPSSTNEGVTLGSFTSQKTAFIIGTNERSTNIEDIQSAIYFESSSPVNKNGSAKLSAYILEKNNTIETVEGMLQLGQRGIFTLTNASFVRNTKSNIVNFSGNGELSLSSKLNSTAKVLIENSSNESTITIKEVSGTISTSSSQNEPSLIALSDIHLHNASFVVTPLGLEGVSGITSSVIVGNEGNDPHFIAIQNKPISSFLFDVFSNDNLVATSNVKGTIITSYNDDPCSQWGTLKGISPQGILATTGNQTVSSFSVGELSECGTPISAYQQGAFSFCYTSMNDQFSCTTPMNISAKNSINTINFGTCTQCTEFEKVIQASNKSLKNVSPKLFVLDQFPQKGSIEVDPNSPLRYKYKISNVQKPTEVKAVPYVSFEFDTNSKTAYEVDSISSMLFSLQNGALIPVQTMLNQTLSPCSEYQLQTSVYLRETSTKKTVLLSDTVTWKTAKFSKSQIASTDLVYSINNNTPTISVVDRKYRTPLFNAPQFWQRNSLRIQNLVQKGIVVPQDQAKNTVVLPNTIDQKTEISATSNLQLCQEAVSLSTTAYPPLKSGNINLTSNDNSVVTVEFSEIPAGIEYTIVVSSYCNDILQQSISKLQYTPNPIQNTSSQQIHLQSILGNAVYLCPSKGYVITIEFPSQFAIESRCLTIGKAPQCSTMKKE
jgi:hypothetical protein